MLLKLKRETAAHHSAADTDRLALVGAAVDTARYAGYLARIYGFEAPLESAIALTRGIADVVDVRARTAVRLLKADLMALGVVDASRLPRCPSIFPFRDVPEALGWMYATTRNTLLHGVVEHHLRTRIPDALKAAGGYLAIPTRWLRVRSQELAAALDHVATSAAVADRIVASARDAFHAQHAWYQSQPRSQRHVASSGTFA